MTIRRFRWNKALEKLVEVEVAAQPAPSARLHIAKPLEPYVSPVSGEIIHDRSQRKADLKRHGCIDARDAPTPEEAAKIRNRNIEESWNNHERNIAEYFADR